VAAVDLANVVIGLYDFLTDDNAFNTSIGGDGSTKGRLRYSQADKNETYPYAVFHVISIVSDNVMTTDGYFIRYQFDIWESEEAGARACMDISDALRGVLSRATYTISGHSQTQMRMDNEAPPLLEGTSWRHTCDYVATGLKD
jgi:hypothetical protein